MFSLLFYTLHILFVAIYFWSWWWTGRPGVLRFMGSQRVGHDWATELNWSSSTYVAPFKIFMNFTYLYIDSNFLSRKSYHLLYKVAVYSLLSNPCISISFSYSVELAKISRVFIWNLMKHSPSHWSALFREVINMIHHDRT